MVDDAEVESRTATIERPLDFMAVTDHAELFGEVDLCTTPGASIFDIMTCQLLRLVETTSAEEDNTTIAWLTPLGAYPLLGDHPMKGLDFCNTPGVDCDAHAVSVWQEMQAAAEEAYDRTAACSFTSFIGYEYTASPLGAHRHRNVIFRNDRVPAIALSLLDTIDGGVPQGLWSALETQCIGAGTKCDAVVIPHNSNLSGAEQFVDPIDAADALRRQTIEPLVEIHQVKGNSECRFDRLAGAGVGTSDELCTFEQLTHQQEGPFAADPARHRVPAPKPRAEALEDGLVRGHLGVNPFRKGFVGSTDTHDAAPAATRASPAGEVPRAGTTARTNR